MVPLQDVVFFALLAMPFIAALFAWLVTGLAIRYAQQRRWLAHPEERSSHSVPTPQVGGIGVCTAVLVELTCIAVLQRGGVFGASAAAYLWLAATVAVGLAVGLWDDLHPLGPVAKAAAVLALAAVATAALWRLCATTVLSEYASGLAAVRMTVSITTAVFLALAFVWIVFFINAFNFMDGVNGQ